MWKVQSVVNIFHTQATAWAPKVRNTHTHQHDSSSWRSTQRKFVNYSSWLLIFESEQRGRWKNHQMDSFHLPSYFLLPHVMERRSGVRNWGKKSVYKMWCVYMWKELRGSVNKEINFRCFCFWEIKRTKSKNDCFKWFLTFCCSAQQSIIINKYFDTLYY